MELLTLNWTSRWCLKKDLPCSTKPKCKDKFKSRRVLLHNFTHSLNWLCVIINVICIVTADHSFFINCRGSSMDFDGNKYEEGLNTAGEAIFFSSSEKWAYSSTGVFMGNVVLPYIRESSFNDTSNIYNTARLSPQSLKYYGLCLRNGSYKVQLHFAQIMFSNDQTFESLGRRIFDILIQVSKCKLTLWLVSFVIYLIPYNI